MAAPTSNNEVTARRLTRLLTGSDGNGGMWGKLNAKFDNRIDRYDAMYDRSNKDGNGWVKLAETPSVVNPIQVDFPYVWDVIITRCQGETSTEQLCMNVRYETSGAPSIMFKRFYTIDRLSTHKFAIVVTGAGGTGTGKIELWGFLEKFWGSIAIREVAGKTTTSLYTTTPKPSCTYYSYTSNGGGTKPVEDIANNIRVVDSTNIKVATSSDVSSAIGALDVASVGGAGKYISAISETDGKISATATTMDTSPTASSTNAVTSGGVKTALDGKLNTSGGAMTGAITRDLGTGVISDTNILTVSGSTDGFKVDYGAATSDAGVTKIYTTDDSNAKISIGNYNSSYKEAIGITNGSAALSNTPTAPTAAAGTNSTQIATTAFVNTAITAGQYIIPDAYCSTAAGTAAKTATCVGFNLTDHVNVPFRIYFTVANTSAGALTLSLNGKTAKPIYINGTASSATNYTIPIGVYWCVYDGTEFLLWTDKRFTGRTQGDGRNLLSAFNYSASRFTATNPSDDINGASYTHNKVTGDSYIQIKATEPIATGEMLTLSFDVSGLNTSGNEYASFLAYALNKVITHTINKNGRCVYYFTKTETADITTGSVVNILDDNTNIYASAPSGITISNIKLERGFVADPKYTRHPSESRVAKADKIAASAKIGDTNKPVYIAADGTVTAGSTYAAGTAVTLNGTSKSATTASFYAPTGAGTSGQLLKSSGSGAPTWATANAALVGITVTSTSVSDGTTTFNKYTHPTYTATTAAAKKIGCDASGHVVFGAALAKGDVGLGSVVNTGDSATPVSGGTTKFTTGGAYTELAKKANKADSVYYVAATFPMDAYSSSKTYSKWTSGAYTSANSCVYNNYAYYCNTAITTAEAWNSAHWTRIATTTWNGTIDGVTEITAGLKIAIKLPGYGGSSSTKLNINGLGEKDFRYNTSGYTTHYSPGLVVFAAYNGSYWGIPDYNSDSWVTSMGGYCSTAAATQEKGVTSSNTVLTAGMAMLVRFTNANTYNGKITMNVNSQGAKDIWINGAVSSSSNKTLPAGEHWCFYDGSKWSIWTNGTVQFKGVHADSYEAKYLTDANLAIPPYITTSTTGGASADFVVTYTGSHIPDANYNWHIHSIVFRESTNYRLTQIATASSNTAITLTYERNAWSSDGTTWTFATAWTEILTSNSTVAAGKISGTVATATTATKLGSSTLGSGTKPIYLSSGTATECSTYAGGTAVTLNNVSKAASSASFYAPTAGGTANYVLIGQGATSAPTWAEKAPKATTADTATSVNVTAATTTMLYLTGVESTGNSKALKTDTGIYAETTSGSLRATQFNIAGQCVLNYDTTTSAVYFTFS